MTQTKAFLSVHLTKISFIYKRNETSYNKFMVRHKPITYLLRLTVYNADQPYTILTRLQHTMHMFAGRTSSHTTPLCNNAPSKYQGKPEACKYCYTYKVAGDSYVGSDVWPLWRWKCLLPIHRQRDSLKLSSVFYQQCIFRHRKLSL